MSERRATIDPESALLERTRSAVMNVFVAIGLGIAASGFVLGRREFGEWIPVPPRTDLFAYSCLLSLVFLSLFIRRTVASRDALRDPATRASRFVRAHVASAIVASLAIPMGFAYGWLIRPRFDGVWPFWVAAVALAALSLPRGIELEDFAEPLPGGPSPEQGRHDDV